MESIPQGADRSHPVAGASSLPPATRVYAIADIHGRPDLLALIHQRIADEIAVAASARTLVVYLGDYIDRGGGSREVIDILCGPGVPGDERVFLKGNHEGMLLDFLEGATSCGTWIMNGGIATLRSYGVEFDDLPRGGAPEQALRGRLLDVMPASHLRFLAGLRLWHVEGDFVFVHAGLRPGIPLHAQDPHDLLWIRQEFLDCRRPCDAVVVHGHTMRASPEVHAHRIAIDTGAYLSDTLTCAVLEDGRVRFLQT